MKTLSADGIALLQATRRAYMGAGEAGYCGPEHGGMIGTNKDGSRLCAIMRMAAVGKEMWGDYTIRLTEAEMDIEEFESEHGISLVCTNDFEGFEATCAAFDRLLFAAASALVRPATSEPQVV